MNSCKINRAIFLDRDGTIIEDRGVISLSDDVEIFPFAIQALRMLQEKYLLFIVTNQSAVGLGKVSKEAVARVNMHVASLFESHGITIQQVYCCAHAKDDNCNCIKPNPYFIREAVREYKVDVSQSYSVGDHPHDVEFGKAAGGNGLYVLTGHGKKHLGAVAPDTLCFENILDAACWILKKPLPREGGYG
jgi:D-glycero-D-manno-heptose 1,7-bisphosphate phosphatase